MAAPDLKPPLLLLLLLASACASTDVAHEPRPAAEATNRAPAAGLVAPSADEEFAELETSLEAYEQQLASNEARLRAMGVQIAVRDDNAMAEAEAPSRFAPPPPPMTAPRKPADLGDQDNLGGTTRPTEAAKQPDTRTKDVREEREKAKKRASRPAPSGGVGKAGTTSASSPAPSSAPRTDAAADSPTRAEAKLDANSGRCAELCDLADSTCDLEGKICDLAARHPGEARFAEVCRRADEDCRIAAEACTLCSP